MENPVITYANETYRDKSVVSLIFEKDYGLIGKQCKWHESAKITGVYPAGIYYNSWKNSINTEFSNGVNTHVSNKNLSAIKNPLDEIIEDST